ncbi:MAG TPA: class I SAM-dependent methyltransferase [Flavisolibacter sp.]|jgi:ubiquinone/menaquinone biosynthesis C-methylase UbiE|nr:class I SAM-dependent methyltransferase [Flavisolibacter sp.]
MKPEQAYNSWASQYDTNENKTRDLEGIALRNTLSTISFNSVLEIGCGTGKNTEWFLQKAEHITGIDLSEEMLSKAKEKIQSAKVEFIQTDINNGWNFTQRSFDLVSFSLVLEHIQNLDHIFKEAYKKLNEQGLIYIGELHPFKQYSGSKARFETEQGLQIVQCYNHNISDFIQSAKKYGLKLIDLDEYFDNDNKTSIPRILNLVLQKS